MSRMHLLGKNDLGQGPSGFSFHKPCQTPSVSGHLASSLSPGAQKLLSLHSAVLSVLPVQWPSQASVS